MILLFTLAYEKKSEETVNVKTLFALTEFIKILPAKHI